ncbi:hypothetical protein [Bradyrhizobium sp. USDA 10063]
MISFADLKTMAAEMPDCRHVVVPGIGHSMKLELPALYARYFGGGLAKTGGTLMDFTRRGGCDVGPPNGSGQRPGDAH